MVADVSVICASRFSWSPETGMWPLNKTVLVVDIHRFWGWTGVKSRLAFAAEYRKSLICSHCPLGSWAFCWCENRSETEFGVTFDYRVQTFTADPIVQCDNHIGTEVGGCCLESASSDKWFSCWSGHGWGTNKKELIPKHDLRPRVRTIMIDNPWLIYANCDWWQPKCNVMTAKETAGCADVAFMTQRCVRQNHCTLSWFHYS